MFTGVTVKVYEDDGWSLDVSGVEIPVFTGTTEVGYGNGEEGFMNDGKGRGAG